MSDLNPHMDAGAERLLEESLERRQRGLDRRERVGNVALAGAFVAVATLIALLFETGQAFSPALALLFVAAYAIVGLVEVWGDTGNAVPSQIVFVPMLLLLPTPLVPLLVAAATVLTAAVRSLRGGAALGRSGLAIADAWFSVAPALVLIVLGAQEPGWEYWWVYAIALVATLVSDGLVTLARVWVLHRMPPRDVLADLLMV